MNPLESVAEMQRNKQLICIQFPGFLADNSRIFEFLGGKKHILECLNEERSLKLNFGHNDPFAIPLKSSTNHKCGVLVRIRKEGENIHAKIIGLVEKSIIFDRPADMQVSNNPKLESFIGGIFGSEILESQQEINIAPKYFIGKSCHRKFKVPNINLDLSEAFEKYQKIPLESVPLFEDLFEQRNINFSKKIVASLEKIFIERPLCTKRYLINKLSNEKTYNLKKYLLSCANYISSGPFKYCWHPKNIDPTSSNQYAMYQTILIYNVFEETSQSKNDSYIFLPNTINATSIYQYCDIQINPIIDLLNTNLTDTYDKSDGWFLQGTRVTMYAILK